MTFATEGGGMGCKRLDLTRYWTRLKAAGYDPCATYGTMMYQVANVDTLQPLLPEFSFVNGTGSPTHTPQIQVKILARVFFAPCLWNGRDTKRECN